MFVWVEGRGRGMCADVGVCEGLHRDAGCQSLCSPASLCLQQLSVVFVNGRRQQLQVHNNATDTAAPGAGHPLLDTTESTAHLDVGSLLWVLLQVPPNQQLCWSVVVSSIPGGDARLVKGGKILRGTHTTICSL